MRETLAEVLETKYLQPTAMTHPGRHAALSETFPAILRRAGKSTYCPRSNAEAIVRKEEHAYA